jgi:hypothetical protein
MSLADDSSEEEQNETPDRDVRDSDSSKGGKKLEPGQVVEIEVLLLKFKQSVSECGDSAGKLMEWAGNGTELGGNGTMSGIEFWREWD